ncbi:MAG: hypothetical protein IKU42_02100, partial [Oscillospiraceae bacterium]|nr:hypothetical protein [Oscillospiraceae bacterium]
MRPNRKQLEKAVETYRKIESKHFVLASKLSEKQILNAIKSYDKYTKPEKVVALLDGSLFGNGKSGAILTEEKIDFSEGSLKGIYFDNLEKAEYSNGNLIAYFSGGTRRSVKIKSYGEEAASLLNAIAKERLLLEKEEPKKVEEPKEIKEPVITVKPFELKISAPISKPEPEPAPIQKTEAPKRLPPEERTYRSCFKDAKSGDVRAMIDIAEICEEMGDYGGEEKWHEAFFWYLRADEEDYVLGSENAARMLEEGIGVPVNFEKALEFYKKSPFKKLKYEELFDAIEEGWCYAVPDINAYEEFVQWAGDYGEMMYDFETGFDGKFHGFELIYISARLGYEDAQLKLG